MWLSEGMMTLEYEMLTKNNDNDAPPLGGASLEMCDSLTQVLLTTILLTTNILECSALAPIHIRDSVQVLMGYWYIVDLCTVYPRRAA